MGDRAISRSARRLRIGVLGVFGIVIILVICGQLGLRVGGAPVLLQPRSSSSAPVTVGDGILVLLAVAVYWLSEALRAVAVGELFSTEVVRRFRLFSLWMLIMALFSTLTPMVLAAVGPGSYAHHRIAIVVDVRDLLLVGITLLLLLIARMFERARALEDEMRDIV
jgi:hypothetical protein